MYIHEHNDGSPYNTVSATPPAPKLNQTWRIDEYPAMESLALLLYALHEQSFRLRNVQMQHVMQYQQQQFEEQQEKILSLLEEVVQKQLAFNTHQEKAQLGKLIEKGIVATLSVMVASAASGIASGIVLPALTAIIALFNVYDTAIGTINYLRRQGAIPPNTLGDIIQRIFSGVLSRYPDIAVHPELIDYFNSIRRLLSSAMLLYCAPAWISYARMAVEGATAVHNIQGGHLEAELAALQANQKTEQALQDILQNCLQQLQKDMRKQYVALEDYIRSTSDALQQQSETTRYLIRNIR